MLNKNQVILLISTAGLIFSGCVTREDIRGLQTDLYGIQKNLQANLGNVKSQTDSVQTTQADLLNNMNDLSSNLAALKSELEDNRIRMKQLSQRLDDLEASLNARMDAQIELLSGSKFVETPVPSTVFNLANADYSRARYPEAIKGFQNYLKMYPKAEQASEAKLKIADSFARQKQDKEAISVYDDFISANSKDVLVPTAMLRKGQLLESSNPTAALKVYEGLVQSYPYRAETKTAQERIPNLKNSIK